MVVLIGTKSIAQENISFSTSIDSPLNISAENMHLDRSLNKGSLLGKVEGNNIEKVKKIIAPK